MNLKFWHNLAFHQFWLLTCEHNLLGGLSYVSLRPSFAPRAKLTFHLPQCSYCQICPRIATLFLIGIFVSITKWAGTQISKWARLIIIIVTYDSTCPLGALGLVYRFHLSSGTWELCFKISDLCFKISNLCLKISDCVSRNQICVSRYVSDLCFQITDLCFQITDLCFKISDCHHLMLSIASPSVTL